MPGDRARECRIAVGEVVLALECASADRAASWREYFRPGLTEAEPDARLRLEVFGGPELVVVSDSLLVTKRLENGGFRAAGRLVACRWDPAAAAGVLRVHHTLTEPALARIFEQLLYQAFHSAARRRGYDAVLVHAAGVVRDGDGFLFVGGPGAGKSAIASLSRRHVVINDEVCLVAFGPDGAELHATPFNGSFREKAPGRAPLRAVLLLARGERHRLEPVGGANAVAEITGQVVPPVSLEEAITRHTGRGMLEQGLRLAAAAPVRRLTFAADAGFWRLLAEEFPA